MALIRFSQTFGGSMLLTFANTIFSHSLVSGLANYAPTVDAKRVIAAGATSVRKVVEPAHLMGVLEAYNKAINHCFYLAASAAVVTFVFSWGMGWKKVNVKKVMTGAA
jgi:hypothetical protein